MNDSSPLPYGWAKQTDPSSGREFYVDTKANPPRSIWTHPYDDEVFLREHQDVRDKVGRRNNRQHSSKDKEKAYRDSRKPKKQGLLARLKNKAVDSMERHNEQQRQRQLMQQQQQQLYGAQGGYGGGGIGMAGMPPNRYPVPQSAYPAGYGMGGGAGMGSMGGGMGMGMGGRRGGMGGGGGMALPLMGGLAGGLLLGDILDNDNGGNGGDYGDGGGGGDYGGGGDFDGGGGGGF